MDTLHRGVAAFGAVPLLRGGSLERLSPELGQSLQIVSRDYVASFKLSQHFVSRLRERFFPGGLPSPRDLRDSIKSARIATSRQGAVGHILKHRLLKSLYLVNEKSDAIYVVEQSPDGLFRVLRTCYRVSDSDWIAHALWRARRDRTGTVAEKIAQGVDNMLFDVQPLVRESAAGRVWKLTAAYWATSGSRKTTNLGSMEAVGPTLEDISTEGRALLLDTARRRLAAKGILEEKVFEVWVKSGKKGTPIELWSTRHLLFGAAGCIQDGREGRQG